MVKKSDDPIIVRRTQIARGVKLAKRIGYGALIIAIVTFFYGLSASFPSWSVTVSITGLIAACLILPLPIVLGYGVRAAEREERQTPPTH